MEFKHSAGQLVADLISRAHAQRLVTVNWNVDPLALRVPETAALLLDEDELPAEDPPPPEDEQAATNEAIATVANPTVVTRWMRRRCISNTPFSGIPRSIARARGAPSPPRPASQPASYDNAASLSRRAYLRVKGGGPRGEQCEDAR